MLKPLLKGQRGFTLIELLAVIAILTVLAGIVGGAITGVGASGQTARLEGDGNTIGKAADRFFSEAFPQRYPVFSCCKTADTTPQDLLKVGDLGVRLIDFQAVLPGNPTKTFAPDFLKEVPDTAALVSWRIVTATGEVFFAQDGTQLVRPSTNRLDVSAATANAGSVSDYTLELRMKKNEAALEALAVAVPAGYSIGPQPAGTSVGTLTGKLSTDNPWSPGQVLNFSGTLKATSDSNKWELAVNYSSAGNAALTAARANRTHQVIINTPSLQVAGSLTFKLDTTGDPAHNQATETWTLTIYGQAGNSNVVTNPSALGVYRWLAQAHTSIDVADFFRRVAGNQAVVLKGNALPVALAQSVTTPEDTPTPITLQGSDPEGDQLTFSVVTQPSHGTLSGIAPNLVYTPALNFNGQDSFTFKVDDGMTASRSAKVNITVSTNSVSITISPVNDAPVALAQSVTTAEDTAKAVTLAGIDVDGDPITFAVASPPSHGTLSGTPPNLIYTPQVNYNGPDSFTYTASDGLLASVPAIVAITVGQVNDAPVANPQSVATNQNTAKAITLTGSDLDGDVLTFIVVTPPAHGSLSGAAPNLTYTPAANFVGLDSFTFKVNDGTVSSAPAQVSIAVVTEVTTALINPSFETGNLSGWTVTVPPEGFAEAVTSGAPFGVNFTPTNGAYFALLKTDGPGSFTTLSQLVILSAGQTISGSAFFQTSDFLPFNDHAEVFIKSGNSVVATVFSASVASLGGFSGFKATPWTPWQYTVTTAGTYSLEARVTNEGDSFIDSHMGLDGVVVTQIQ